MRHGLDLCTGGLNMIVGILEHRTGDFVVLPLDKAAQHYKTTEYAMKQALEGKAKFTAGILVKMPNGTTLRPPNSK